MLFGDGPQVLLQDASGRIEHRPDFISVAEAADWFARLHDGIPWRAERRLMYERELDVPRLLASYRLAEPRLPEPLGEAARRVAEAVGAPFNSVGLNLYRDEHDSVAMHNDRLGDLVEGQPIALLSLGGTRRMLIRAKRPPRRQLQVDLEPGSLLLMDYATQLHYDHGIPKERVPAQPRISLAFRVRRLRD